jgi:Secretion system C-terminal sorting domain
MCKCLGILCVCIWLSSPIQAAVHDSIPNRSFELWADSTSPIYWGTWSTMFGAKDFGRFSHIDSAVGYATAGKSSLRLYTDSVTFPGTGLIAGLFGFASLGGASYTLGSGVRFGTYPYKYRPDTLYFDYRYIGVGQDSGLVSIFLSQWDTVSLVRHYVYAHTLGLPATNTWVHVAYPMTAYAQSYNPDSLQLIIRSGNGAMRGSTLWIDDIHFNTDLYLATALPAIDAITRLTIFPNPTTHTITLLSPYNISGSVLTLLDIQGQQLYAQSITGTTTSIDVSSYPTGIYQIAVRSADGLTYHTTQVAITH